LKTFFGKTPALASRVTVKPRYFRQILATGQPLETKMIRTFTIAAILALTTVAAQARDTRVAFADLDIANPAGAQMLAGRLHQAAAALCAMDKPNSGTIALFYGAVEKGCVNDISTRALARIRVMAQTQRQFAQRD
jgi:UrcA family protein